jgi:hypothetical protein
MKFEQGNLPDALYAKIVKDEGENPYQETDLRSFRTTQLIGPPLPITLKAEHGDEITLPATSRTSMFFGTVLHKMCEGEETDIKKYELALSSVFTVDGINYQLNGTIDEVELMIEELGIEVDIVIVTDNKTCLLRNLGYEKPEYNLQLNIYTHLLRRTNKFTKKTIYKLRIRYFIKDWTSGSLQKELDKYPDDFAVWLEGNKVAKKSCKTYEEAVQFIPTLSAKLQARASIVPRDRSAKRAEIAKQIPDSPIHIVDVPVMPETEIDDYIHNRIKYHVEKPNETCLPSERWSNDVRCRHFCDVKSVCPYAQSKGYND